MTEADDALYNGAQRVRKEVYELIFNEGYEEAKEFYSTINHPPAPTHRPTPHDSELSSRLKDQANIAEDREDHRGAALLRLAASRLNPPPPRYEPPPLDRGPIVRTWPDTGPPLDVISTHEIKEGIRDAALLAEVDAVAAPLDGDLLYSNRPADTAMLRSVTEVEGTGAIVSPLEAVRAAGLLYVVTRLESIVRDLAEFPLHECSACRADIVDGRELNTLKARARAVLDGDKA